MQNFHSVKTLMARGLTEEKAVSLRNLIHSTDYTCLSVNKILTEANCLLGHHGVEYIRSNTDAEIMRAEEGTGLLYTNSGDTYTNCLIFDEKTARFTYSDWGTIVERDRKRFGE